MIEMDVALLPDEREVACRAESGVSVILEGKGKNILAERKSLIAYLAAIADKDAVVAVDHSGERFWSPEALAEETRHAAPLDVDQLFVRHAVANNETDGPVWLHTHGLASIGRFDFDVLKPSIELFEGASDVIRCLAFHILEGNVQGDTDRFRIGYPRGVIGLMPVRKFLAAADPQLQNATGYGDEDHIQDRSVVINPRGRMWNRWRHKPNPSRFLSKCPDNLVAGFSNDATALIVQRSRLTYTHFLELTEKLREFEFVTLVKLGYPVDGGSDDEREHLWFQAHQATETEIDATLLNAPIQVSGLKEGDRRKHPVSLVTEWRIMTPMGDISPHDTSVGRYIDKHRDKFVAMMHDQEGPESTGRGD